MRSQLLLGSILLASLAGCKGHAAQQIVEERLEKHTPSATHGFEVVRCAICKRIMPILLKRTMTAFSPGSAKSNLPLSVEDVQVEFKFGRDQRLIAHRSKEMRVCL